MEYPKEDMSGMKFCQSCAMPIREPAQFATERDGSENDSYCIYCYKDGAFTTDCTMEEMIETCVPFMVEGGMPEAEARRMMTESLPKLKRWQS